MNEMVPVSHRNHLIHKTRGGCQHAIASAIIAKGADYLLALKGNQKSLHGEVALFFDGASGLEMHTTTDADHGRVETRRASVCHGVDWLNADRAAPGEPRFARLATIGMVEAEVEKNGETTRSRRFYISSGRLTAVQLSYAARAHWGIENRPIGSWMWSFMTT